MGHRFFASPGQITETLVTLSDDESHHLTRVMRLGPGAVVSVIDGHGHEYRCQVDVASRSHTTLHILEEITTPVESELEVTLGQALVKNDKFDWVVQKATELGVRRIVPLITSHSEVLLSEERGEKRIKRWDRISLEALKQCGRRQLVEITSPLSLTDFLTGNKSELRLVLSERGGKSLESIQSERPHPASVSLAVGPEGGWESQELAVAVDAGHIEVNIGPRILRTETAAIAAIALAQFLFGDLNEASD